MTSSFRLCKKFWPLTLSLNSQKTCNISTLDNWKLGLHANLYPIFFFTSDCMLYSPRGSHTRTFLLHRISFFSRDLRSNSSFFAFYHGRRKKIFHFGYKSCSFLSKHSGLASEKILYYLGKPQCLHQRLKLKFFIVFFERSGPGEGAYVIVQPKCNHSYTIFFAQFFHF